MNMDYELIINNPNFDSLGYIQAVANLKDKHDRSAPSDYHWKILKCRMIIFSNASILACPDKLDVKKVHIIFNKMGDDYDKVISLFVKFSLVQDGPINVVTPEKYQMCFEYTLTAKLAPIWNVLGREYLVNNRDFLIAKGPQEGVQYHITTSNDCTKISLKGIKIHLLRADDHYEKGEWVRVLPSLNKAVIEDCISTFPNLGLFRTYKEIRRHWKNIHGYRLPEEASSNYCQVRFWRGDPLTYPKMCVIRNFPIITPLPKVEEKAILNRFITTLQSKMPQILGAPLKHNTMLEKIQQLTTEKILHSQAVSLCTPTQAIVNKRK